MTSRTVEVPHLVESVLAGSPLAVARLISLVEAGHPAVREVMAALAPHSGRAWVIGLTGPPGVGKSTTTAALVKALRARGLRVGVLAIDPSSPFSGGALLGDRIRMEDAIDPEVYLRSMASRGHLGGLSLTTPAATRVLEAAGCEVVLIETVGVGQGEVSVAGLADTCVVLLAPGMGDGIQAAKAGILEIADVFVVNKADHDGAEATVHDLRHLISLGGRAEPGRWRPPVVKTIASHNIGIAELVAALDRHRSAGQRNDLPDRRRRRAADEIEHLALATVRARMVEARLAALRDGLTHEVLAGRLDPYAAADQLVDRLLRPDPG